MYQHKIKNELHVFALFFIFPAAPRCAAILFFDENPRIAKIKYSKLKQKLKKVVPLS